MLHIQEDEKVLTYGNDVNTSDDGLYVFYSKFNLKLQKLTILNILYKNL